MIRFLSRLTACLFYLALGQVALAKPPLMGAIIGKQAFHGPGSRGFHATCSGIFAVGNFIQGSANYTAGGSSWVASGSTGLVPTVNGTPVTAPDGTNHAYQVTFPTVSGASKFSVISETPSSGSLAFHPLALAMWAQTTSSPANGHAYISLSNSTNFVTTPIPTDGAWHLVTVDVPAGHFTPNSLAIGVQVGINTFDTVNQVSSTGTIVVNLSYSYLVRRPSDALITMADVNGPLATTTAAVSANLTKPCPPGVAFRDFRETLPATGLSPFTNNPFILQSQTELYQSGGLSNPYTTSTTLYYNGYYWGFTNSTPTIDHSAWTSFSLYKSHDGIKWTEVTTNAPYLQAFGSIFANPTVAAAGTGYGASVSGTLTWTGSNCSTNPVANVTTTGGGGIATATYVSGICTHALWPTTQTTWSPGGGLSAGTGAELTYVSVRGTGTNSSFYQLNPSFLPYGCTISSVHHQFCVEFGTSNPAQSLLQTYLAWSDTVDGVYTPVGCTGPGTCSAPTPVIAGACTTSTCPTVSPAGTIANQNLPSIVNVGGATGTNYTFTSSGVVGNSQMQIWASPAIPTGSAFTWAQTGLFAPITGTWDATASATYANPMVWLNKCGFYEMMWTAVSLTPGFGGSPNKEQVVGYAVSAPTRDANGNPAPLGPWFKYSAPIIPVNSSMFFGTVFIGDASPIVVNGRFIWIGNFDNGVNLSEAMGAAMQDACSY